MDAKYRFLAAIILIDGKSKFRIKLCATSGAECAGPDPAWEYLVCMTATFLFDYGGNDQTNSSGTCVTCERSQSPAANFFS
jgi:hypothetical protein